MLIQFTVGNYLSFKDKVTLSMEATSIKEHADNVFESPDGRYRLLKSVAIYGANASGKSNLVKAIDKMQDIVRGNSKLSSTDNLGITPFRLNTFTEVKPSFFEIVFLIDNIKYRYGFEVDDKRVNAEWLFQSTRETEKLLFLRDEKSMEIGTGFKEGKGLETKTGSNKLFLAISDLFNGQISTKIIKWFAGRIFPVSGLAHNDYSSFSSAFIEASPMRQELLSLYKSLDLGFDNVKLQSYPNIDELLSREVISPMEKFSQLMKKANSKEKEFDVKTIHAKYDEANNVIGVEEFDMIEDESKGTNKLYDLSSIILPNLKLVQVALIIDELDASLHPLMTIAITKLFNSTTSNVVNSHLIFTTHDTNLLREGGFRRDQIYFMEKDRYGASHLYSLSEFKVRNDASYEKDYIQGRYGAIPFIGDFSKLLTDDK